MSSPVLHITSRENPLLRALRKLCTSSTAWRTQARVWAEGEHLAQAAVARGWRPLQAVYAESFWPESPEFIRLNAIKNIVVPDVLFDGLSSLPSPARMGVVLALPERPAVDQRLSTVVLDRLQDAGNVGSILRSAAAFGHRQVIALQGTAALWSPKVLRAGMGAHFGLRLIEAVSLDTLDALTVPLITTSSHEGELIQSLALPSPCAWVFGHEGQGVRPELMQRARVRVRIAQPGGEESLNVAAAAAICLHASAPTKPT